MTRRINLWAGAEAWDHATPQLKRLVVRGARLKPEIADLPFLRLNAEQTLAIAASAGMLSWCASELEAMAPIVADEPRPRMGTPFPKLFTDESRKE